MDDEVAAGAKQAVLQALSIIKQLSPPLGLFINTSKCELFSKSYSEGFPDEMHEVQKIGTKHWIPNWHAG